MAAAVAGNQVMQSGAGIASAGVLDPSPIAQPDPLRDLFYKHRHKAFMRREAKNRTAEYMPHWASSKKSWSPAYRAWAVEQEERKYHDLWETDMVSPEFMKAALQKIGVEI